MVDPTPNAHRDIEDNIVDFPRPLQYARAERHHCHACGGPYFEALSIPDRDLFALRCAGCGVVVAV